MVVKNYIKFQRNQQLTAGLGYATWTPGNTDYSINFSGVPNNGLLTVPVYHNEPSNGFPNLLGNPYPSAIDLDKLFEVNADLIDPVAFIWGRKIDDTPDPSNSGPYQISYSPDSFIIYNPNMIIIPAATSGNKAFNSEGILASGQSFFVQTTTSPGSLVFNNSMRTTVPNNTFAKIISTVSNESKLWLNLKHDASSNQLGIAFSDKATDDFSSKEDVKAVRNNTTTFYSIIKDTDVIINTLHTFDISKVVLLGVSTTMDIGSTMSISINKKQGLLDNNEIYIYDKLDNSFTEISKIDFTFKVSNAVMDDRFVLVFEKSYNTIDNKYAFVDVINKDHNVTVKSFNNIKIKSISVYDIYTPSISGVKLFEVKDIHKYEEKFDVNREYKLLLVTITLEDGSIINKKILN